MAKKRANGEGSIRKRKDGRWEGRYTAGHDPNTGKAIYKNVLGKTQSEVKEKLKKAIADSQQLDVTRATTYTVRTWIKLWYEVYAEPRLREKTNHTCKVITKKSRPKWTALIIPLIPRCRRAAAWGTAAGQSYRTARCARSVGVWCTQPFPTRP